MGFEEEEQRVKSTTYLLLRKEKKMYINVYTGIQLLRVNTKYVIYENPRENRIGGILL